MSKLLYEHHLVRVLSYAHDLATFFSPVEGASQ